MNIVDKRDGTVLLTGEFYDTIKADDSYWQIEDNEKLLIFMEKGQENIWSTVIKGDKEIDTKTVDNSKKIQDFDPETQVHTDRLNPAPNTYLTSLGRLTQDRL